MATAGATDCEADGTDADLSGCLNVNTAVIAGGLYFGEFAQLTTAAQIVGFATGIAVSFAGVICLGWAQTSTEAHAQLKEETPPAKEAPTSSGGGCCSVQ